MITDDNSTISKSISKYTKYPSTNHDQGSLEQDPHSSSVSHLGNTLIPAAVSVYLSCTL